LQSQLPDLENTLEMIKTMKAHKGQQLKTDFLLSDDVYAKAHIQATDNVYLWLGVIMIFNDLIFTLINKLNTLVFITGKCYVGV
jgi:hypothetical protein